MLPYLLPVLLIAADPTAELPKSVTVRVSNPDGTPAVGAEVWPYRPEATPAAEPPPAVKTAPDGRANIPLRLSSERDYVVLFARDSAGLVSAVQFFPGGRVGQDTEPKMRLVPSAERTGRVVNEAGKPVPGAVITPVSSSLGKRSERGSPLPLLVGLPPWEQSRAAATTDADGRFAFRGLPAGYEPYFKVEAAGREVRYRGPAEGELVATLARPGRIALVLRGVEPAALKGIRWTLNDADGGTSQPGVHPQRYKDGKLDGTTGSLTVRDVVPGRYQLTIYQTISSPVAASIVPAFEVRSGLTADVVVNFGLAAKVTGKVVDARGKGVAGLSLYVGHKTNERYYSTILGVAETAADGTFAAYGPAGSFYFQVEKIPDGYAAPLPSDNRGGSIEQVRAEPGKPAIYPNIVLVDGVTFVAKVVLADGTPAAGAEVVLPFSEQFRVDKRILGKDGTLTLKNLNPADSICPRFCLGKAVHTPQVYRLSETDRPVTVELSEAVGATIRGRVTDPTGAPVADAKAQIWHVTHGFGRHSRSSQSAPAVSMTTDKDGRYEFSGLWPGDQYEVKVSASGYADGESGWQSVESGRVREMKPLVLARSSLTVAGVVVDSAGKPVAGVTVYSVDGLVPFRTTSAADGSFKLTGFYDTAGFVFAEKKGFRLAAVPVLPAEKKPTRVVLRRTDEPPPGIVVPKEHAAADRAFTRHVLTLVYQSHPQFGYGGNALANMARIDPAQARKWAAEERKRTDGKTNWEPRVSRAERVKSLPALAATDIDEAIAALHDTGGETGFWDAIELARKLLPTDPAKAARVAEEAGIKARQLDLPGKIWALAEVGEVAARAGNPSGGRKLIEEAAALADKLPPTGRDRNTLARGIVAARLAPFDWPRAKAMLDALADPSEFNRFLAATCSQLAGTDLPRAKALFATFKQDNTFYRDEALMRVAYRIAPKDPAGAESLIDSVVDSGHRFQGFVRLAVVAAPHDKPRAVALIDRAMALLDTGDFRGHGGNKAAYAVLAMVRGQQIGHPDVPGLIARTLAARPAGRDGWGSSDNRMDQLVNVAAALALVDPAAGRHVLAGIAPPDKFVAMAAGKRRDWLFALALCDPDRAVKLADARLERAKAGGDANNALSYTGLVELGDILTADDRYHELAAFGDLPREIREED